MADFYGRYNGIFGGTGGGGGGSGGTWIQEAPTGTVNAVNVTFTLSQVPTASATVILSQDGITMRQGGGLDYTISGSTITMAVAPSDVPIAQTLWAIYQY